MARDLEHMAARLTVVTVITPVLLFAASTPVGEAPGGSAKANGCKTNIDMINSQIELYYANKAEWPKKLDDVTKDEEYFPDGEPKCPVDSKTKYSYDDKKHRVTEHDHSK